MWKVKAAIQITLFIQAYEVYVYRKFGFKD